MDTILTNPQMVVEDRQRHLFRVSRRAFTDQSVLDAENRNIFDRCWLYLGHSSEIANNCDFITRNVGGRELIFNRDRDGACTPSSTPARTAARWWCARRRATRSASAASIMAGRST